MTTDTSSDTKSTPFADCVTKAKADGKEDPNAFCRVKLAKKDEAPVSKEMSELLGLDDNAIEMEALEQIAILQEPVVFAEDETGLFEDLNENVQNLTAIVSMYEYEKLTRGLTAVSGTPEELAGRLVAFEQRGGEELALEVLEAWNGQQKFAEDSGVLAPGLMPGNGEVDNFLEAVAKYADEHASDEGMTIAVATRKLMKTEPALYRAHRESVQNNGTS